MWTPITIAQNAEIGDILKYVVPAFVAMATVISVLWTRHVASHRELLRRSEECEAKHAATTREQISLAQVVGELKGRQDGIEQLSQQVLDRVTEAITTTAKRSDDS
jgi:hypothetical protein